MRLLRFPCPWLACALALVAACADGGSSAGGSLPAGGVEPPAAEDDPPTASAPEPIDLLVLVDRPLAAVQPRHELTWFLAEQVAHANAIYARSGTAARLRLVAVHDVDHIGSGDLTTEVGWVESAGVARSLRDRHGADLVCLITAESESGAVGRARLGGFASAIDITAEGFDDSIMAHEFAHNLGVNHHDGYTVQRDGNPYAQTLMSVTAFIGRIGYLSTTRRQHRGWALGSAEHDAAAIVDSHRAAAAARRVALTAPQGELCLAATPTGIEVEVSSDLDASEIARVHILVDGQRMVDDDSAPYRQSLVLSGAGRHRVTAVIETRAGGFHPGGEAVHGQEAVPERAFAPWRLRRIGGAPQAAVTALTSGSWRLSGSGTGVGSRADHGVFLHHPVRGDFSISARIHNAVGSAGLMVRAGLEPDAAWEGVYNFVDGLVGGRYRAGLELDRLARVAMEGRYLRLERRGQVLITASSDDGITWTEVHRSEVLLPDTVHVGAFSNVEDGRVFPAPEFHELRLESEAVIIEPVEAAG